jgi:hypothetical protein
LSRAVFLGERQGPAMAAASVMAALAATGWRAKAGRAAISDLRDNFNTRTV